MCSRIDMQTHASHPSFLALTSIVALTFELRVTRACHISTILVLIERPTHAMATAGVDKTK